MIVPTESIEEHVLNFVAARSLDEQLQLLEL